MSDERDVVLELPQEEQDSARGGWELAKEDGHAPSMADLARPGLRVAVNRPGPNVLIELDAQVYLPDAVRAEDFVMLLKRCPVRHAADWWIVMWGERVVRIKLNDWQPAG